MKGIEGEYLEHHHNTAPSCTCYYPSQKVTCFGRETGPEVVEQKGKLDEYGRSKQGDGPNASYNITPKVVRIELLAGVESFTEPVNTDSQTEEQVQSCHQTCDHERIEELSGECGLSGHVLYVSLMFIHEHDDERPKYKTYS